MVDTCEESVAAGPTQARTAMRAPASTAAGRDSGLPARLLSLQRTGGNRATGALIRSQGLAGAPDNRSGDTKLARCAGGGTCGGTCSQHERLDELALAELKRAALQRAAPGRAPGAPGSAPRRSDRIVLAEVPVGGAIEQPGVSGGSLMQRSETSATPSPGCDPATASCQPPAAREPIRRVSKGSTAPVAVDAATAREIVDAYVRAFSGMPGAVVVPWSNGRERVAANEPTAKAGPTLATWPSDRKLARSPGLDYHFLGGFVGSLQLCYDLCTAELSLVGWVWAGGGVEADYGLFGGKQWWGAYVFAEHDFGKTRLDFMPRLSCGTCEPACVPAAHEDTVWGAGVAGFPIVLAPGERKELKMAGVELGALITPTTACSAVLEVIALLDITQYIPPPYGIAIIYSFHLAQQFAERFNIKLECGAGFDLSGSVNLCTSVPGGGIGGITSDSAKICAGGFAACNVGLSHSKSALPGGGH